MSDNLYDVLGVPKDADKDTIRKQYKKRAGELHPDKPDTGDAEKFVLVKTAYDTLHDDEARARYDNTGQAYSRQQTVEQEAHIVLAGIFVQVFRTHLGNVDRIDLIVECRKAVKSNRDIVEAEHAKLLVSVKALEKVKTRLKTKSNRLFYDSINAEEYNNREKEEKMTRGLQVLTLMAEILEDYNYETDSPPSWMAPGVHVTTTSTA